MENISVGAVDRFVTAVVFAMSGNEIALCMSCEFSRWYASSKAYSAAYVDSVRMLLRFSVIAVEWM